MMFLSMSVGSRLAVGVALCLLVGMTCAWHLDAWWLAGSLLVPAAGAAGWAWAHRSRRLAVIALLLFVVALGTARMEWTDARNQSELSIFSDTQDAVRVMGLIATPVEVDGDRVSFQVETRLVHRQAGERIQTRSGERVQIAVRLLQETEQQAALRWERGQYITLSGQLLRPDEMRNAGGFDYREYLRRQHVHRQLRVKGLDSVQVVESSFNTYHLLRWSDRSRAFLANKLDKLYSEPHSGFMKGILLGLRDSMDPEQYQRFSLLGLTHIIAISGLNVGIFVFGCLALLRLFRRTMETNYVIVIALLPLYILLTGASPSVVRAGLMAMIALWAARQQQLKDGLTLLSSVAVLMLLWNGYYLADIGFQLSFLVTFGLLLGVPLMNRLLPVRTVWLKNALAVTTVAQLAAFPLSIYYFNQFSLLSWTANLVLVPYVSLLIYPLGLISLLLALLSETVAGWVALVVTWLDRGLFAVIDHFSSYTELQLVFATPPIAWLFVFYAACALIFYFLHKRHMVLHPPVDEEVAAAFGPYVPALNRALAPRYLLAAASAGMLLFVTLLFAYWPPQVGRAQGSVSFLDVGQGDAILVTTPERRHLLIDAGGTVSFGQKEQWAVRRDPFEIGADVLVPLLKKRGVQQLDWLVVSHQDADHIGGMAAVLRSMPVKRILFNGTVKPKPQAKQLFELALARGVQLYEMEGGEQLQIDDFTTFTAIAPVVDANPAGLAIAPEQNEYSLAGVLTMFETGILFTGDMGAATERAVLSVLHAQTPPAPVDVLKVAHHGSKSSTASEWLEYWRPGDAVISVGRNNLYRHPHPTVLQRLTETGATIWRTDRQGEIQLHLRADRSRTWRTMLAP